MARNSGETAFSINDVTALIEKGEYRLALKKAKKYLNKADSRIAKGKLSPEEFGIYVMTKFLEGDCYLKTGQPDKALKSYQFLLDKIQFKKDDPKFRGTILRRMAEVHFQKENIQLGIGLLEQAMNAFFDGKEVEEGLSMGLNLLKILVSLEKVDEVNKLGKTLLKKSKKVKDSEKKRRIQTKINLLMWEFETHERKREKILKLSSKLKNDRVLSLELAIRALMVDFSLEKDQTIFEETLDGLLDLEDQNLLMDFLRLVLKHQISWEALDFLSDTTKERLESLISKNLETSDLILKSFYMNVNRVLNEEEIEGLSEDELKLSLTVLKSLPANSPLFEALGQLFITTVKNLTILPSSAILIESRNIFLERNKICESLQIQLLIVKKCKEINELERFLKQFSKCRNREVKEQLTNELRSLPWVKETEFPEKIRKRLKDLL